MAKNDSEIRIQQVSRKTHDELKNIAKNLGVHLGSIIKPKLAELANSYPEKMKLPPKEDPKE